MPDTSKPRKPHSDFQVITFIIFLCLVSGFLLAVIAYSLHGPQEAAKEFDQSKQMLIAANILNHKGYFEIRQEDGNPIPAKFNEERNILVPVEEGIPPKATDEEIKKIAELRIRPLLTNKEGEVFTLEEKNINLPEYLSENKKEGYSNLPLKLLYVILPNESKDEEITANDIAKDLEKADAFVIPVSGFGLWAPIYGFLAIEPNGNEVIGTTWYEQAETPGLGANISEGWWQKQFNGKEIFQQTSEAKPDLQTATLGIIVVKGSVKDVFGSSPRSKSAVDGLSGATLTGDGVTKAYRNSLQPYREFLIKIHKENQREREDGK